MSSDDVPTPRQTGSFAIMSGICHDSILELGRWLAVCPATVDDDIFRFIRAFKKCGRDVMGWTPTTPVADKQRSINEILKLRTDAQELAKRWGYVLR